MGAAVRAYGSQIHPVFMLPALAASWFGSILAVRFSLAIGLLHMAAIFFAVYTAHLKDGYVDFYVRSEDDDHPLTQGAAFWGLPARSAPSSGPSAGSGCSSTIGPPSLRCRRGSSGSFTPRN